MASAKFLEEALSTDVDESAVNAIVGSLETQLVTSAPSASNQQTQPSQPNHHVTAGGIANGATIGNGASQAKPQSQTQKVANGSPPDTTKSAVTQGQPVQQAQFVNQTSSTTTVAVKTEPQPPPPQQQQQVKIIYPQVISSGVINAGNKIAFPAQTVSQLANGAISIAGQTTSNVVPSSVATVVQSNSQGALVNKPTGTALVIKTSVAPTGMVSVPMSVPVSVAANAATTLQAKACVTSTIVPSNVQILNVNAMRPPTPVAAQQQTKQVTPRVVIGQQIVNARPGTPITLQTVGLQPGTPAGHLLLKTENGQYQLLRVGPPPAAATPGGTAVTPNSISGNTVVAAQAGGTTTYRLASVPAVSRLNTQFTGPPLATIRKPVQTVAVSATTASAATTAATVAVSTQSTATPIQAQAQRPTTDNTKEKCRKFLANLLELSSREPKAVERNVRTLIQELIDTTVEPEEFCDRLEKLLHASPQPCLIGFLKKSLPLLRQSLVTKELVIEGIRPPPPNVVFSIGTTVTTNTQNVIRPTIAVTTTVPAAAATVSTTTAQIRVMAPLTTTSVPRPAQPVQQRMIRPGTTVVRSPLAYAVKTTVAVSGIRPSVPTVQKPPTTTVVKTITPITQGKTVNAATTLNKAIVPSILPKPAAKEKEKKTFSSAGYTGDDDINDVAAMGGVNLAEESQRILGSTEFVGTQIRSCKDEIFLQLTPLQQKIKQIANKHGLEEPSQEIASMISHAVQERLKNLVEKLAVIAEHRIDFNKTDPRYEVTQDVRAQLKFLEELDRVERKRHQEQERENLMRLAKSRAKTEDPEQAKLKARAKELQRAELEELRQREANLTALQAIGPRKKPRLDSACTSATGNGSGLNSTSGQNRQMPLRPRLKRVNLRDLLFLIEQEKETRRSVLLYKLYLK